MEPILQDPENSRAPPSLADNLLEEILVRIDVPADLIRASAACKAFRSVITDPNFLHRYRSLHPPLLLGFVCTSFSFGFQLVVAPHVNAPAALAFTGAASFSFNDYLPDPDPWGIWHLTDSSQVHNGRVLLRSFGRVNPQIAVCDPLAQEYTLLPPIPDSLLVIHTQHEDIEYSNPFFDPSLSYNEEQYRVMCWTYGKTMGGMFIYSSEFSSWTNSVSIGWDELGLDLDLLQREDANILDSLPVECPSYAYGCLYWFIESSPKLIKLDISCLELSTVSLPDYYKNHRVVVVEAGRGRIGMLSRMDGCSLRYSIRWNEFEHDDEQHPTETKIPLPIDNDWGFYYIHGTAAIEGYIFLIMSDLTTIFSLEIKTMKVERVWLSERQSDHDFVPYFGYPPFMSSRRI